MGSQRYRLREALLAYFISEQALDRQVDGAPQFVFQRRSQFLQEDVVRTLDVYEEVEIRIVAVLAALWPGIELVFREGVSADPSFLGRVRRRGKSQARGRFVDIVDDLGAAHLP